MMVIPQDLLDVVHEGRCCSQDDIERVRQLLARAPADQGWRRRRWLAMFRSRTPRANANAGGEGAGGVNDAGSGAGENRKMARIENSLGVNGGEGGHASSGVDEAVHEMTGAAGNEVFSGVVVRLVGLEPEGVFRTVLKFL